LPCVNLVRIAHAAFSASSSRVTLCIALAKYSTLLEFIPAMLMRPLRVR
jgi:hypothetical protein